MQQGSRPAWKILAEASTCAEEARRALADIRASDAQAALRVQEHFARTLGDKSPVHSCVSSPQQGLEASAPRAEHMQIACGAVPVEPLRARFWAAIEHLQCSASEQQRLNAQWAPVLASQQQAQQ
mmetsp:Transcript_22080/g.40570  ORF Transcript_22080/g.40570 Transcript_22080/m.40570 type:complete len:125 (+) Transcript_22080:72-446(+)